MFQLQISDVDVTSGSIPVSWCLDEETIKELANQQITDPQVVICAAPANSESQPNRYHPDKEYRKVVPLKDLMTYIEFRSAGLCKIWGFISFKNNNIAKDCYLEKHNGDFTTNIISYDGNGYAHWLLETESEEARLSKQYFDLSQPIDVYVPEESFASKPAKWEAVWVNHFFKDKAVDQCDFRRRRLFAYGVQPFIMLANLLVRFLMLIISCLLLFRNTSTKWLLHPLTYSLGDATEVSDNGSLVVFHQPEDDVLLGGFPKPGYWIRSYWLFPAMPMFWIPILFLVIKGLFALATIIVCLCVVIFSIILLMSFVLNYFRMFGRPFVLFREWLTDEKDNKELWYLNQEEMNLITCSRENKPLTFNILPPKHKTIRLRFQNLKSKVCKPFSR